MRRSMLPPRRWIALLVASATLLLPHQASAQPFYAATDDALNSVAADDNVLVFKDNAYWAFLPPDASERKDVGIIYHSAPLYDERAYAPIARDLANTYKYPAFILDLPLSLAFLTPFRADVVRRDFPEIKAWVVAGHGVGGAIASCYAQWRNMEGLALFSSYPFPLFNSLKWNNIQVISLWGSLDGVTKRQQWEDGVLALPGRTRFIEIEGANHSQMAYLKETVCNDNEATISRDSQQAIIIDQLLLQFERIENSIKDDPIVDDDCIPVSPSEDSNSESGSDTESSSDSDSGSDSNGDGDTDSSEDSDEQSGSDTSSNTISLDTDDDVKVSFDCGGKSSSSSSDSRDSRDYYRIITPDEIPDQTRKLLRRRLVWSE